MVRAENFEISTYRLKAGCSAPELYPRKVGCKTGLEPVTRGVTSRCAANCATCTRKMKKLVAAAGIEPATGALSRHCSTTELCGYEEKIGSTTWGRTGDDAINNRALYQLSYRGISGSGHQACSPLAAFADALIQVAVILCLPPLRQGVTMPRAAGGDDAAQQGTNNAAAGRGCSFGHPPGGHCVSGCHGKSP